MIYKKAKGSILTDEQAERYGEHIDALIEEEGGVTPEIVLADAKSAKSPLHEFFEWDDGRAAQAYRLKQAGYLLRSIHVVIKKNDHETNTRAWHPVTIKINPESKKMHRVYTTAHKIFSDKELRQQVVKRAMQELDRWRGRYSQYSELGQIFEALDAVVE